MLWIGIHLPALGLEIFKQRFPETPNKPSVLAFNNKISVIDQRAREHGMQVGSSLATAHSLTTNLIHLIATRTQKDNVFDNSLESPTGTPQWSASPLQMDCYWKSWAV